MESVETCAQGARELEVVLSGDPYVRCLLVYFNRHQPNSHRP